MQFSDLLAKVKTHPEQQITFVDASGAQVNRNFGEFGDDVDALISKLRDNHIRRGMRVGILGDNSYDWMVWDVALLTIGCVSVVFPVDAFGKMADELIGKYQLSYLAVSDLLGLNTSEITQGIVPLELASSQEWYKPAQHEVGQDDALVHSLVFSSGTSGHLKGLTISGPGTENLVTLFEQAFGFEEQDSHMIFLPFAGYQQRMVYYGCLYNGAAVVTVPYLRLFHELRLRKPTFIIAPPMFFETVHKLTKRTDAQTTRKALDTLLGGNIRCMITGMAAIKRESLDYFWEHDIALYEAYGITEAGMVAWNKPALKKIGSVGSVAEPGTVVLGEGNEVIICRDKPLSLGYFEASEEDSRVTFIRENTVATGDIGEFDEDGFLTLVGRKKDIIVTKNGQKFHPETIEVMLNNCQCIEQSVIIGGDGIAGVVAMLNINVAEDEAMPTIKKHIDMVNGHLPDYQRISKTVVVAKEFNLENGFRTQNLKINRKAIRKFYEQPK